VAKGGKEVKKYGIGALLALTIVAAAFISGFFYGKQSHRDKELRQTIEALHEREKINETIHKLDDVGLCVGLGGLRNDCARLLRRLGEAAAGE